MCERSQSPRKRDRSASRRPLIARRLFTCALLLTLALSALAHGTARAQNAQKSHTYQSNNYAIDLFQGPVLSSGRIVGMGGAYGAIATGIDGSFLNPAGYAERAEEEIDWYEWELTGGVWLGGLLRSNDFDNNGTKELSVGDALQLQLGGRLQFGHLGVGLSANSQQYDLDADDGSPGASVDFTTIRAGGGYAFLRGSLVVGGAARAIMFDLTDAGSNKSLVSFSGVGGEVGALLRPAHQRYRTSITVRTPVESKPNSQGMVDETNGVRSARGFVLPKSVHVPWEVDLGFAYQLGEHRTNVPWRNTRELARELRKRIADGTYEPPPQHGGPPYPALPADEKQALRTAIENDREAERRYLRHQPRRYVLLTSDVIVYGPTDRGQGIAAFLLQRPEASGQHPSYGVRVGTESEIVPNRLRVRGGSYLEPSRFRRSYYRPHVTAGFDVRLFDLWHWSIRGTATADVAPRYFDWGLSLGFWY